jgi:hypothetical protein
MMIVMKCHLDISQVYCGQIRITLFWYSGYPEDEGSMFFRNIGSRLHDSEHHSTYLNPLKTPNLRQIVRPLPKILIMKFPLKELL